MWGDCGQKGRPWVGDVVGGQVSRELEPSVPQCQTWESVVSVLATNSSPAFKSSWMRTLTLWSTNKQSLLRSL